MNPKHLKKVPDCRKAVAPYNFTELPEKVVEAQLQCNGRLCDNDRYYPNYYTGRIECTLTTESPLYIRCGLTPDNFSDFGDRPNDKLTLDQRQKKAEFFQHHLKSYPVLPGSSLRGMLRTLVEIVSFGKIGQVSDHQRFFFRAVAAATDDPLSKLYRKQMRNVMAGYLVKTNDGWSIRPVSKTIDDVSYVWVKEDRENKREKDVKTIADQFNPKFITLNQKGYLPQYKNVSFETIYVKNGRTFAKNISADTNTHRYKGVLVSSGNMKQEGDTSESPRRNHCIVLAEDKSVSQLLKIDDVAIKHYRNALTDFQKEEPFDENMGVLEAGRPIFYCKPQPEESVVTLFGQSPNFRIPYSPNNDGQAASAVDFIPKEVGESDTIDLADAIFGFVRRGKNRRDRVPTEGEKDKREQSRAGRIFISDAQYKSEEDGIWLTDKTITPHILASPKPTTFQHYLVQPEQSNPDTNAEKSGLKHYAKPITDTVIRGHKLYWHKGNVKERIKTDATEAEIKDKRSQYTEIKPIKAGVSFKFTIHFENLSCVEVGALLWVLTLAGDEPDRLEMLNLDGKEKYRLSLGMGKPLGMGAVKIEKYEFFLDNRQQRYTQLFDNSDWFIGDRHATSDEYAHCIQEFEKYVIANISQIDRPTEYPNDQSLERLKDIPRIQMLLAMLSWNFPPAHDTRYMEIERKQQPCLGNDDNEYKARRVLPTPFQVMKTEQQDKRRFDDL